MVYQHQRFMLALDYLQANLHKPPGLSEAADVACLSEYHWHRVFHKTVGITMFDALKNWRLHQAGVLLATTDKPIKSVAQMCGYSGNVQSFVRIFRKAYGVTPSHFRTLSQLPYADYLAHKKESTMYDIQIKDTSDLQVVSLPHTGDYMKIGDTVTKLESKLTLLGKLPNDKARYLCVFFDDQKQVPKNELRSMACTFIGESISDDEIQDYTIAGGRYVLMRHVGAYANLHQAYEWFFGEWLPASEYEFDDSRPCFEEYLNDWQSVPAHELLTDIYLPIK